MQNPALPALGELMQRLACGQARGLLLIDQASAASENLLNWPDGCAVFSNQPGHQDLRTYRQSLGLSHSCVVIDCRDEINADAVAALCGTIVAKGVLVLLLPAVLTPFLQRLLAMRPEHASHHIRVDEAETSAPATVPELPAVKPFSQLTGEQEAALQTLQQHLDITQPALLHAPRGRGKSTVLGHLCAHAASHHKRVFVCAPSRHQARTLLSHACASLTPEQQPIFIAPDALIATSQIDAQDVLILDEAASLPRHMLEQIIERYPQVKMATTTDGYEGCGRGFVLQFCADLQTRFAAFTTLHLSTPQRWASNCPLERWLDDAFLLPRDSVPGTAPAPEGEISYQYVHASELTTTALRQCFQLLLDAHYQTTPNDLKMLLDDPRHHLLLQRQGAALVGVAWLTTEGELSSALSDAIWRGSRRPAGNLLAQSLTYYLRDRAAATERLVRVVRIAITPQHQSQGLGSKLLRVCIEQADACGAAAIGTSFGLSSELIRFWQMNGFKPCRVGSRRDSVSGRYSALFVRPLSTLWARKVDRWQSLLCYHLQPLLHQVALPQPVVTELCGQVNQSAVPADYHAAATSMIRDFASGYIDFASIQPVLYRVFAADTTAPELLRKAAASKQSLSQQAADEGFSGRKNYVKSLRQICLTLDGRI